MSDRTRPVPPVPMLRRRQANTTTGALATATGTYVGHTVEASRLVVRAQRVAVA